MAKDPAKSIEQPAPLPAVAENPIPQVTAIPVVESGSDPCPYIPDGNFVNGLWVRNSDGEEYALCIHKADSYGQTHTARNSIHQWQGTAELFNAAFQRK